MRIKDIDAFALSVVSGNPTKGNTPEEIVEKSIDLYFAAIRSAEKYNENLPKPKGTVSKKPDWMP